MVRTGDQFRLLYELEGGQWTEMKLDAPVQLAGKLEAGIFATSSTKQPFTTRFSQFRFQPKAGSSADGWVQLFNGKDLVGWKTHPNQPGNWRVENGVLVGSLLNGNANHLFSERADYQDFHLRAEVQIDTTGNSGIYFRSPFDLRFLGGKFPPAYEVAIYNDDGPTSYDEYKTGSIHAVKLYPKVLVEKPALVHP